MTSLIDVRHLTYSYPGAHKENQNKPTLKEINFSVNSSSTLGIVGESGSGKSTLIRLMCGLLEKPNNIFFEGISMFEWRRNNTLEFLKRNQIIFQNPRRSFDPRMKIGESLCQPVRSLERRRPSSEELTSWIERVGLQNQLLDRYPHQISGGQLQRAAIARSLSVKPTVLYADEPTSALDVSVQAQILNLLMDLREEMKLTLIMVTHNLAVVSHVTENVLVLKDGRCVEFGRTVDVLTEPKQPYTRSLVQAASTVALQ